MGAVGKSFGSRLLVIWDEIASNWFANIAEPCMVRRQTESITFIFEIT